MWWGRLFRREGENMTEPIVDYSQRAGARERPSIWVEPDESLNLFAHTRAEGTLYAATGQTFYADISQFQVVVDGTYPYPVLGFRADNGSRTDSNAAANWRYCEAHPTHIRVAIPYVVFKPGQSAAIMARLKNLFGNDCPPNIVPEIDMESGSGFAGPGNHSSEANALAAQLAAWTGNQKRVQGYANSPDWSGSWPTTPSWMKKRLAYYSSNPTPPGYYARQYFGALPYPSPAGYPRTCAPFGSYVDMNVTPRTITQIEADYGIGDADMPLDATDHSWLMANLATQDQVHSLAGQNQAQADETDRLIRILINGDDSRQSVYSAIEQAIPLIATAVVNALPPRNGGSGPSADEIATATRNLFTSNPLK